MPGIRNQITGGDSALIVMPGTGSDADYLRRSFGPTAARLGMELIALQPRDDLVAAHLDAIDQHAARYDRFVVGGVSIGGAIAVDWALRTRHPGCVGVWAALPAWSGEPDDAPAAWSARATAASIADDGLDAVLAAMSTSSPPWLAAELSRSWRALFPGLVDQLLSAAAYRAPAPDEISRLTVPLALVASPEDPVHPIEVARAWCAAAPVAGCAEVTLAEWGTDPAVLGRRCAEVWTSLSEPEGRGADRDQRRRS